ncbi:MAG TPA: hypothetical protein VKG26_15945 [Bacteroidia bacterium]|nr:hypothetical protein [Bacteroidia bacterium]
MFAIATQKISNQAIPTVTFEPHYESQLGLTGDSMDFAMGDSNDANHSIDASSYINALADSVIHAAGLRMKTISLTGTAGIGSLNDNFTFIIHNEDVKFQNNLVTEGWVFIDGTGAAINPFNDLLSSKRVVCNDIDLANNWFGYRTRRGKSIIYAGLLDSTTQFPKFTTSGSVAKSTTVTDNLSLPDYYYDNIKLINSKFTKEFAKYSSYIQDKEQATKLTDKLFEEIAKIKFQNVVTELMPMNSIKVKVKLDTSKMLIITSPFKTAEGLDKEDVFYTFLVDNNIIISDVTNLTNLIDGVNKVL